MLITPQQIEEAASRIVEYWNESTLPDADKNKILEMVKEYYESKDEYLHDQYLAALTKRTVDQNVPQTGFERSKD